jgi:hypothetical protein
MAMPCRGPATVAGCEAQAAQRLKREHQEGSGSARGVEDTKLVERSAELLLMRHGNDGIAFEPLGRYTARRECGGNAIVRESRDECGRCVERSLRSSRPCVHQRLKCAAKHLWIDRGVGPGIATLTSRQTIPGQQPTNHLADGIVLQREITPAAFDWGSREEATIQERNTPEAAGRLRASAGRGVEGAEPERLEEPSMRPASSGARRELSPKELPIAVEPTACFQKRHKEEPRGVQECDGAPCFVGRAAYRRLGERRHSILKLAVESIAECIAPE